MAKKILQAIDLNKEYIVNDQGQQVLINVNLQVAEGEFVTVMGASGSGKSTLLFNLSGMDNNNTGKIYFNNFSISELNQKQLANLRLTKMGFIFQQPYLLKNLNIIDNIILSAYYAKDSNRNEVNKRALDLMSKTGITELAHKDITQASGGQLQRVGICRALINNPLILFGDEPTGALNSKATNEIMDLLNELNLNGTTIMLVTHDIKVAIKSERVLYMVDGAIVGEKVLGKFQDKGLKEREQELSEWLFSLGF